MEFIIDFISIGKNKKQTKFALKMYVNGSNGPKHGNFRPYVTRATCRGRYIVKHQLALTSQLPI